jgi:hypothetical protein
VQRIRLKTLKTKKSTQSPKGKQHCLRHQGRLGVDWFGQDCRDPDNVERNPSDIDASTGARAYMNMAIVTAARTLNGSKLLYNLIIFFLATNVIMDVFLFDFFFSFLFFFSTEMSQFPIVKSSQS